ncbi:ThuA domain-containing protein [Parenemella sanctibonifatiensis]|uniref:Glycosyl hydrolase n=1 Tax=Parenemella sanctibonifatiensis TaxID=2016505 RepID=A0A255EB66_9ACTN|nr:ThuA domain-containing protein [Parenemella sanctibonifatiensis]OYN88824.1 glycosyl hydrolase [Parenemella sanctibonifatiensis]
MSATDPTIRVVRGHGRYTDPWHPFVESSDGIASVAREHPGASVDLVDAEPAALADLSGVDLVILNTGTGTDPKSPLPEDAEWAAAHEAFGAWIDGGGKVIGTHTAAASLRDWPRWSELLGGQWVRGVSMHPPRSDAHFRPVTGQESHPLLAGLPEGVRAFDERYSKLTLAPDSVPVLEHELEEQYWSEGPDGTQHGARQLCVWVSAAGLIYDALGHGPEAYESPGRRRLLANEIAHLLN